MDYMQNLDTPTLIRYGGIALMALGALYFLVTMGRGKGAAEEHHAPGYGAPSGGGETFTAADHGGGSPGLDFEPFEPLPDAGGGAEGMVDRVALTHGNDQAIMDWAAQADAFEGYESGHAVRVAKYARALAERYGLPPADVDALEAAALLHDVGEVNNDNYIQENRPLSPAEITQLWEHPLRGEQIVRQMPNLERAALWVRWSHEWWDGTGYPDRLREEDIPIAARILTIADAYDAMTNDRPYRAALSAGEAEAELRRKMGIMFDPQLVEQFLELLHGSNVAAGV